MAQSYSSSTITTELQQEDTHEIKPVKSFQHSGPTKTSLNSARAKKWYEFETPLIWVNIISITLYHIFCVYCILTFPFLRWKLVLWGKLISSFQVNYYVRNQMCKCKCNIDPSGSLSLSMHRCVCVWVCVCTPSRVHSNRSNEKWYCKCISSFAIYQCTQRHFI